MPRTGISTSQENHPHGRHRTSHCGLVIASANRSVPVGHCAALSAARPRRVVRLGVLQPGRGDGDHASRHGTTLALAERIPRARDRFDSPRVSGSHEELRLADRAACTRVGVGCRHDCRSPGHIKETILAVVDNQDNRIKAARSDYSSDIEAKIALRLYRG
jgi:hypothetical protein